MAEAKQCPQGHENYRDALYCATCGVPLVPMSPKPPAQAKPTSKAKLWLVILGMVGAATWCVSTVGGSNDPTSPENRQLGAEDVCETFVERALKAPSTAKFSGATATGGGNRWTVRGAVDAENSFGAMLRMNYTCTVEHVSGENWQLVSLTGLG
jgi:hypothetical protein